MQVILINRVDGFDPEQPIPDACLEKWGEIYVRHPELHGRPFGDFLRRPGELTKALVLEQVGRRELLPRQRAVQRRLA